MGVAVVDRQEDCPFQTQRIICVRVEGTRSKTETEETEKRIRKRSYQASKSERGTQVLLEE